MREPVTASRVNEFMKVLGTDARQPARVYLVGGSSAVLLGWRNSTVDIDLKAVPEGDDLLRALSRLKERLKINIELASPGDFIPELPAWQERSRFIRQEGKLTFLHYDFYAQALAKIERGHESDLRDVQKMATDNLIVPERVLDFFSQIEADISRYPALDAASFRRKVQSFMSEMGKSSGGGDDES